MNEASGEKLYLKMEALDAIRRRDLPAAIEKYQKYLELNPKDDDAWAGLGGAYRRQDAIDSALNSYATAFQINSQSTYALVNIISLLAARGSQTDREELKTRLPEAIKQTRDRIKQDETDYWAWYDLATLLLIQGMLEQERTPEAIKTFFYAVGLTPKTAKENFRSVLSNLDFLRDHNKAIPGIDQVIELIEQQLK